jgi:hypothetical protein
MAIDIYGREDGFLSGGLAAITKSDATVYDPPLKGIMVTAAGTVQLVHKDGSTAPVQVAAGILLPVSNVTKVMSTGTTATGIVAWTG